MTRDPLDRLADNLAKGCGAGCGVVLGLAVVALVLLALRWCQ